MANSGPLTEEVVTGILLDMPVEDRMGAELRVGSTRLELVGRRIFMSHTWSESQGMSEPRGVAALGTAVVRDADLGDDEWELG